MADDQEKTEVFTFENKKGIDPFFYACRYGTKEKFYKNFCEFF